MQKVRSSRGRPSRRAVATVLFVMATLGVVAGPAEVAQAATIVPVTGDAAGALTLGQAVVAEPTLLTGAVFDAIPPTGTPNGVSDSLSVMPTQGQTFGILTTGDVNLADDDNSSQSSGEGLNGANVRGDTDFDVSVLKLELNVPAGDNCLLFDFAFYSEEFDEFVGGSFNDAFIAELDSSTWTTSGSTISAPNNFAFDPTGEVISVNSTGATSMTAGNAAGTTYDGATTLLQAATPVTAGAHKVFLSVFDQGDHSLDSAAFVDNLRTLFVLNPATDCKQGAEPAPKPTAMTYTGAVTAQYSDPAALSAKLEDTSVSPAAPLAGKTLDFALGTQTTSGGPTAADGSAAATLTVDQEPASVSNVIASFAGDANYAASSDTKPFQVAKEDCTLTYVGDVEVDEGSTTSLAADLGEPDTSLGNRANKTITFKVVDSSGASQTFNATTDANGHAVTSQTLTPGVYTVSASFAGDGFYQGCQTAQDTKVTVTPKTPVCTVTGTPGNDLLHGTEGDDVICGLGGNDRLFGHGGNDLLLGGPGDDRLEGSFGTDELHGQNGNDLLLGGPDADRLFGGNGDDRLEGSFGTDELHGQNGNDRLLGGRDNDKLLGGAGNDRLEGSFGTDELHGQNGNDLLLGGPDADRLFGGNGDDRLWGGFGTDELNGEAGNDALNGGPDSDQCNGGAAIDTATQCEGVLLIP